MREAFILVLPLSLAACATTGPSVLQGVPDFPEPAHISASVPDGFDATWWLTRASPDFSSSEIFVVSGSEATRAAISNGGYDAAPAHWNRGVLFTSTREGGWDLWFADDDGELSRLPEPVNSPASECCSVVLPDGNFLFSSDRGGDWSIYQAVIVPDGYEVRPLAGSVNSEHGEWPSYVSPDGTLLLFSSIRPDGIGGDDIYVSQLGREGWNLPCLLPEPVNRDGYEDGASIVNGQLIWSARPPEAGALSQIYTWPAHLALSDCGAAP